MKKNPPIKNEYTHGEPSPHRKNPFKNSVLYTPEGQWAYPGQVTKIPGNTMATHGYGNIPLWTVPDVGNPRMVYPNTGTQYFEGASNFTEYPQVAYGGDPSLPAVSGWLDELDEEYRRGGPTNPLMLSRSKRNKTSKNIQSSINKIFLRNHDIFGPGGKNIYDPKSKYELGGGLDEYQNAGSTGVKQPYIIPEKDLNLLALPKAQQEIVKQARLDKINKKPETQISQGRKFTKDEQAYSDKVSRRIKYPFSDIGIAAGNVASYLSRMHGLSPEEIAASTNNVMGTLGVSSDIATQALANELVGQGASKFISKGSEALKPYIKSIESKANSIISDIDNSLVTPIQFRKDIKAIKNLASKQHEVFKNPIVEHKLEELGIDPAGLQSPHTHSNLSFQSGIGSAYYPWIDHINIDMRQIKRLKKQGYNLSPEAVYQHELGHKIQQKNWLGSPEYKEQLTNSWLKNRPGVTTMRSLPTKLDKMLGNELGLEVGNISDDSFAMKNFNYFQYTPVERLAHLREMRQGMIEKGIIKDEFQPITSRQIHDYVKSSPNDRIASFIDKDNVTNYSKLRTAFKYLPAAVPLGLGIEKLQEQKYGGQQKGWLDNLH
jgi:hypothetical protein